MKKGGVSLFPKIVEIKKLRLLFTTTERGRNVYKILAVFLSLLIVVGGYSTEGSRYPKGKLVPVLTSPGNVELMPESNLPNFADLRITHFDFHLIDISKVPYNEYPILWEITPKGLNVVILSPIGYIHIMWEKNP